MAMPDLQLLNVVLMLIKFEAAYITGILPIKKYGTQSAMTDFKEYTMTQPEPLEAFVGFTEQEVQKLCVGSGLFFEDVKKWYDGYILGNNTHIYSPKSVMGSNVEHGRGCSCSCYRGSAYGRNCPDLL